MESEDFWNTSKTAPSTLDNFFDEESDVNWKGGSKSNPHLSLNKDELDDYLSVSFSSKPCSETSLPSTKSHGTLSSIVDNISIHSDSVVSGFRENRSPSSNHGVGKALGSKIENWKASSSIIRRNKDNGEDTCSECHAKTEKIDQLNSRLEKAYARHSVTLPPEDTIKRLILGKPYSFEGYRTFEDKISLIEHAVAYMDTSAILAVVVFLKNTLKTSLFNKELMKRPEAAQTYLNYLKNRAKYSEALDILALLGKTEEAALLKYQLASKSKGGEAQVKALNQCLDTHFNEPSLAFEAKMVKQHRDLIRHQIPIDASDSKNTSDSMLIEYPRVSNLLGQPLLTSFYYCCMYHYNAPDSDIKSPVALRKFYGISDRQVLWTLLRARGRVKHWPLPNELESLVVQKSLLSTLGSFSGLTSAGKAIKSIVPIEKIVDKLAEDGAQGTVLAAYINLLDSNESKLKMALFHKCHLSVIEVYKAMKDKVSLENYLKQIPYASPEYIKAEHAIKNIK